MDLKTPGGCCTAAPTLLVDLQTGSCAAGEQLSKGFPWLSSPCFFVQAVNCWDLPQSYAFDDLCDANSFIKISMILINSQIHLCVAISKTTMCAIKYDEKFCLRLTARDLMMKTV